MNYFRELCRSARGSVVHNLEQKADQEQKNHNKKLNFNSINFNANGSLITANLKTSSSKAVITVSQIS